MTTVIITDLGNDIQFTFSNGDIYILNKLTLKTKQTSRGVYVTDGDGFVDNPQNKVIWMTTSGSGGAAIVTSPVFASDSLLLAGILGMASQVTLGGGASAGGGASVWSTKQQDFLASVTVGTKNITITGLSWVSTMDRENVAIVELFDSTGDKSTLALTNINVSSGTITLGDIDDFVTGDTVSVTLIGQDKSYDESLDNTKVVVQNSEYSHYTDPSHIVDAANIAANDYFVAITGLSYRSMGVQFYCTDATSISMKVFGTLDKDAAVPATGGTPGVTWKEITTDLFGGAVAGATVNELEFLSALKMYERILIQYSPTSGVPTNTIDVYLIKF